MPDFRDYLDYAERYLILAEDEVKRPSDTSWLLIPATILAWGSIESFVNDMLDDFSSLPKDLFELHERAFLLEERVSFVDKGDQAGQFVLKGTEYHRLEDKILFLIARFSTGTDLHIRGGTLWQNLQDFKKTRDSLVHPRRGNEIVLSIEKVRDYIKAAKAVIKFLSQHVWNQSVEF